MGVTIFALPDLGEGLDEAEIVEWHVAPGDRVVADQPLVSVETGKAVVEVPAPWAGTIEALHAERGETVAVGAPLVSFGGAARADRGAIVGDLAPEAEPKPAAPPVPAPQTGSGAAPRAMPAARALARREGVDLGQVAGSGPGGVIRRADVARLAAAAPRTGWTPLSAPRRAMARNMAASGASVVPATIQDWADVTDWAAPGADILLRLVRALVAASSGAPALNAWFDAARMSRRLHERLDLGLAVDTEAGLYVPVLRDAGSRDAAAMRAELDRLIAASRARRLGAEDQAGATLSLSNFGPLGGEHGVLVVTPPQVAILGAGRIGPHLAWGADGPAPRQRLPLSLSFDHRAVTGGEAAHFLGIVRADLERPA
jgi:2-oxoisovalerate dehydrogenase E2 component (dihydrolipoyl transacylase)